MFKWGGEQGRKKGERKEGKSKKKMRKEKGGHKAFVNGKKRG